MTAPIGEEAAREVDDRVGDGVGNRVGETVRLRPAKLDDLNAIMRLEEASFPTDAWTPRMMHAELASAHSHYVVLESGATLVGYAGLRAVAGSRDGDIQTIAVAAASRGHGWGRMLLTTLIDEAVRRGVQDLFLEVRADNPVAQALYDSEGFQPIGRRPRYYQPDDVDAIVMQADLRRRADGSAFRTQPESAESAEHAARAAESAQIDGVLNADPATGAADLATGAADPATVDADPATGAAQ